MSDVIIHLEKNSSIYMIDHSVEAIEAIDFDEIHNEVMDSMGYGSSGGTIGETFKRLLLERLNDGYGNTEDVVEGQANGNGSGSSEHPQLFQ